MKLRLTLKSLVLSALLCFATGAMADIKLPEPQTTGGKGIYDVLKARSSASLNTFPQNKLTPQDLSNILWAATGMNRTGKGWTTPYGRGVEPYNKIYVACEKGVSLYDWKTHSLKKISSKDIRTLIATQAGAGKAPVIAIIVSDGEALDNVAKERARDWAYIASGAITQNMYLAAASMDIGTRYIVNMHVDVLRKELKLNPSDLPLCLMPLGKN